MVLCFSQNHRTTEWLRLEIILSYNLQLKEGHLKYIEGPHPDSTCIPQVLGVTCASVQSSHSEKVFPSSFPHPLTP